MAVVQSTYNSRHPQYVLGQVANQELANFITALLEDASVGFGVAMFQGTGDKEATATPSAEFLGVTVRDVIVEGATADTFYEGDSMTLCNHGVIVVQASVAVDKGAQAYVTDAGAWTDVATDNNIIAGATFDATTSGAGLVPVRIK